MLSILAQASRFLVLRWPCDESAGHYYRRRRRGAFPYGLDRCHVEADPATWGATIPGIDNDAARFLASFKPLAVGADTWGLGAVPPKAGDKVFYDHAILLKENGIYILETMNTGRLASEGVTEFMFVLGQARLKGAVQMVINPVAMW